MDTIISKSVEETIAFGESLGRSFVGGEIIALQGDLGAGKTHLVKGIAQGLGFSGEVTSPTFMLLHEYQGGRLPLYHLDLYRMKSEADVLTIGIEDYLPSDGVSVFEWPERASKLLPPSTLLWTLKILPDESREIRSALLREIE